MVILIDTRRWPPRRKNGELDRDSFIVKVANGKQQVIATVPPIGAK